MPPKSNWQKAKQAGTAQHFTLVHRPQTDPRVHDDSAPSMVLNPTQMPNASKVKKLGDLASELGSDAMSIRDNEGEAANYGVYYDDTEYDYMQHMREIGTGGGEAVFVEAKGPENTVGKGKGKQSLEEALRHMELEQKSGDLLDEDILPSKDHQRVNYQSFQDVPDALAGFQPDMDPRLREVLEALEDDAYVDDDEVIFQALSKDAKELNDHEFDETYDEYEEEDGYESDHTAKPAREYKDDDEVPTLVDSAEAPEEGPPQDWLENFKQFKKDQKTADKKATGPSHMDGQSSIWTTTTMGGRKKKRKGALTNPSAYSMTSSALVRNEQLTILDARFDKMEERYMDVEDEGSIVSGMSTMSSVQRGQRQDFDGILDEFLGSHAMQGKRRVKRGKGQSGVQELDEVRKELGPARISGRSRQALRNP